MASRPPPPAEAPPPSGPGGAEAEVGASKWSRFLSARHEDDEEEEEEEAPRRNSWAGASRGQTGSEEPLVFPSVVPRCFKEGGRVREEVQGEGCVTDGVFARNSLGQTESLTFSPVYQRIQNAANHRAGPVHLNSGLLAKAAPVCQQNLSISKPRPSLPSLFQTDEDFDETF